MVLWHQHVGTNQRKTQLLLRLSAHGPSVSMPSDGVDPLPRGSASTDRAVRSWAHPAGFRGVELRFPWKPQLRLGAPLRADARCARIRGGLSGPIRARTGVLHQPARAREWTGEQKAKMLAGAAGLTGEQLSSYLEREGVRLADF